MRSLPILLFCLSSSMYGQSLGTAGTIRGKIADPSGAVVAGAVVSLSNDLTLYRRDAKTSASGEFQFTNIPPNVYHIEADATGFEHYHHPWVDVFGQVFCRRNDERQIGIHCFA